MKIFLFLLKVFACILLVFVLLVLFFSGLTLTKRVIISVVFGLILFLFWTFCSILNKQDPDEGLNVFEKKDR